MVIYLFDTTSLQDFLLMILCIIVAVFLFKVLKKVAKVIIILAIAGLLMYYLSGCGSKPQGKTNPTQTGHTSVSTVKPEFSPETDKPTNTPMTTVSPQIKEDNEPQPTVKPTENPKDKIKVKTSNIPLEERKPTKKEEPTPEPTKAPVKDKVNEEEPTDEVIDEEAIDEEDIPDIEDIEPKYYGLVVTDTSNKDGCEFTNTDNTYAVTFTNTTEDLPLIVEFHVDVKDLYGEDIEAGAYTETVFPGESVEIIIYEGDEIAGKVEVTVLQSVAE